MTKTNPNPKKSTKDVEVQEKVGVESLVCNLTDQEAKDAVENLLAMMEQTERLEEDRKATLNEFKEKLDEAKKEVRRLRRMIESGTELRPVEFDRLKNFKSFEISKRRRDTGEIYKTRPMEAFERQKALELKEGGKDGKAKKETGTEEGGNKAGNASKPPF